MTTLRRAPRPRPRRLDDVVVRVSLAGLCRTDCYVADGRLPCAEPRVLGHEFAGVVEASGPGVRRFAVGDRVAVMPLLACRRCLACSEGSEHRCLRPALLGVDRDGAFAEAVVVPERSVHLLPEGLDFRKAAYAEPVAAALAVLHAGIAARWRGVIWGRNRIAELTRRVLEVHGIKDVALHDPARDPAIPPARFDFVVEAGAAGGALSGALDAVRPGGLVVLKSRPPGPVPLEVALAVRREVTLRAVHYGRFESALALLADGSLAVEDLLGDEHPLEHHAAVFRQARRAETRKLFFAPQAEGP